jgi:GT2 family glycosyltransferase
MVEQLRTDMNMPANGRLYIVIPVLNRWEQTRTCLTRLQQGTCTDFTIIVVDHGSTDGTRTELEKEFPDVIRIPGTLDMWWTGATNLGIKAALERGADTIMLLNNDCYFQPDTLARLVFHLRDNPGAIIAPVQRNLRSGKITTRPMTSCFLLGFPILQLPGRHIYSNDSHYLKEASIIIGGRGVLIPAGVFRETGLLNESELPHYGSDLDFYLRSRKHGFRLYIAQNALVDVDEATTTLSSRIGRMSLSSFIDTLKNRRSHRNIPELTALFRLHYPIPGLYLIGVSLNLLRYTLIYAAARLLHTGGAG